MTYAPVHADEEHVDIPLAMRDSKHEVVVEGKEDVDNASQPSLWLPLFLRPATFIAFILSYFAIGLTLAVLAWYSSMHQGISTANTGQHYVWTYAPTAAFTLVAAFWGQVDYRARQMMPWVLMAKEPQTAERSVLLDYISPNVLFAWVKSWMALDLPLAVALTGTILIKILVILSAGLFALVTVEIQSSPVAAQGGRSFATAPFNTSLVNAQAMSRVYGINKFNMSYPLGTNASYANELPPFRNESASTVSNRATIDVLSPRLECEFGTLQKIDSVQVSATLASSSVNEDGQDETSSLLPYADGSEISFSASVTLSSPSCSGISAKGTTMEPIWTIFTDSPESNCTDDDYRFVFGFINSYDDRTSEFTSESNDTGDSSWLGEVSSFLVCKPDYSLQSADFKFNPLATTTANRSLVHILDPNEDRKLGNITGKDMFKGFYKTLDGQNPAELLNTIMPQDNTTRFIDQELLHDAFGKLYSETVAQLASLYLMEDGQKTFYVSAITTENRIKLRGAAFWITEAIIMLLMVYCGSLAWMFRKGPTPRDPGSITGLATILARSVEFRDSLRGSGLSSLERIRGDLSSFLFKTETVEGYKDTFRIRTLPRLYAKEGQGQLNIKSGSNATKWYYPFIVWIPTRIVLVVWAVALIAALEAVYELSKRDNGFLTILSQEYVEYYWHYVPVTIFLLFGMAVATLDFEMKTFEPFYKLRRGPAPSSVTVDEHYFSLVGIHALWTAARKRQCAIIATSIALVCTPFLTILASGLYYADSTFQTTPSQLRQTDSFDLETFTDINKISSQANGVMAANLVVNDNMDLPEGTYDNFAIPTFSLPSSSAANTSSLANTTSSYITVTVPALQPVANCTPITPSHINITQNTYYDTIYELDFKFSSLPPCGDSSQLGSTNPTTSMAVDTDKDFGYWTDRSSRTYHCPEYFAIAGHFSASLRNLTSLSILHCSPYVTRLPATIQLTYPALHIRRTNTPSLDLSAATNGSALEILDIGTSILSPYISASALAALGGNTTRIDGFFGTLARLGSPLASLASDSPSLATAVEALYPRIATQILNLHRNSTTTSSSPAVEEEDSKALLNATLSRPNHLRLRQSAVSTHVLAALLAVMAACVLASMGLLRGREVLPKCPRSVAGGASLVAGGRLADGIVEGEKGGGKEEEEGFSMGFWREEDDGERAGDGEGERLRLRFGIDVGCADVVR